MPAVSASAPGKIILFGEHAVVYGQPAIAVPLSEVKAKAIVSADPLAPRGRIRIQAPNIGLESTLEELPEQHPLGTVVRLTLQALGLEAAPAFTLRITSTIPVASGLGSGAAVSVAVVRAVSQFLGRPLAVEDVSALAYEVEKLHHGTPSGIDNTVIAHNLPIYFVRGQKIEILPQAKPFTIVVADTGIASPTSVAVGDVRQAWLADPARYDSIFAATGALAQQARQHIENGAVEALGPLMDANHARLQEMGVSSPELDALTAAARSAGALGAKLSGGGRGGNMIALGDPQTAPAIVAALLAAGAARAFTTQVGSSAA